MFGILKIKKKPIWRYPIYRDIFLKYSFIHPIKSDKSVINPDLAHKEILQKILNPTVLVIFSKSNVVRLSITTSFAVDICHWSTLYPRYEFPLFALDCSTPLNCHVIDEAQIKHFFLHFFIVPLLSQNFHLVSSNRR